MSSTMARHADLVDLVNKAHRASEETAPEVAAMYVFSPVADAMALALALEYIEADDAEAFAEGRFPLM